MATTEAAAGGAQDELGIAHCSVCGGDVEGYVQQDAGKHADLAGFVRLHVHEHPELPGSCIGSGSWFRPLT